MSSGGGMCNVGEFILGSTVGQPPVGFSAVGDLTLHSGFWQDFGDGYLCGDVDNSGTVNIADAVYLISYIFGGPAPEIMASADVDCSGTANMADAVYLIGFIFGVNPDPCDPDGNGIPDCP
jgi:hypothetical protein